MFCLAGRRSVRTGDASESDDHIAERFITSLSSLWKPELRSALSGVRRQDSLSGAEVSSDVGETHESVCVPSLRVWGDPETHTGDW